MRGTDGKTGALFSYVDLEARVRKDHPLRTIRLLVNDALERLQGDFAVLYSGLGRPSIPPERLLRAMLLQAVYSIRSERQLMERLEFDLLFRWFVGLGRRRSGVGPLDVFEEPGPPAGGRCGRRLSVGGFGAATRQATSVDGALQRRRYADRSLGIDEEL